MPIDHEDAQLRIQCLRLAIEASLGEPVAVAEHMYAFVTGAATKSPREIILGALDAADVA